MKQEAKRTGCVQEELVSALAIGALPAEEIPAIEAHITICAVCREDYYALKSVTSGFSGGWPAEDLSPSRSLWDRLGRRISQESGRALTFCAVPELEEVQWEQVA